MSAPGFTPISLYHSTTAAATPSAGNLAAGELAVNITDGKLFYKDNGGVVRVLATAAGSAGDVVGPGSSTDNALVRFDGTTGKLVQNSAGVLSDAGALSGLTSVAATTFTGALTGNASTATTLQTSRTIWGQSFDGSANVTGALTGVTDLTASGSLTLNGGTANGVPYLNGSKVLTTGSALTFDGTTLTNETGSGVFSSRDNFNLNAYAGSTNATVVDINSAGTVGITKFSINNSEQMRLTSTGLGIGTSSPAYKLDVSGAGGAIYASVTNTTSGSGSARLRLFNTGDFSDGFALINNAGATGQVNILNYKNSAMGFWTNANQVMTLDSSGRLQVSPTSGTGMVAVGDTAGGGTYNCGIYRGAAASTGSGDFLNIGGYSGIVFTTGAAALGGQSERARIDSSGNLLVGTTSTGAGLGTNSAIVGSYGPVFKSTGGSGFEAGDFWNASTTGDAYFVYWRTEAGGTVRGSVNYNRSLGLTSYNTTSDRRAKDILGPVTNSGETIDAIQVHIGQMHGATQSRPMFIADELQGPAPYCVTGEKNAVNEKGEPVYQQVDHSPLIPLLVAEIQSLRKRLAAAGIA